jgi:hypothetical protein
MKPMVVEQYRVECTALGLTFDIPIFERWRPKDTEERRDGCVVWLEWPEELHYETARQLHVQRIPGYFPEDAAEALGSAHGEFRLGDVRCFGTARSPRGLTYGFAFDPGLWVSGYQPRPGQWDYLQLYGEEAAARIIINGGDEAHGFSTHVMVERIVATAEFRTPGRRLQ